MSTISGIFNTASSLLAMLKDRPVTEAKGDNSGNDKSAKATTAAANTSPAQSGGSSVSQLTSALMAELVQMQAQTATANGDASQGAPGSDQSNAVRQSALSPRGRQLFAALDTDGSGQVSKTEFESALTSAGIGSTTADATFKKLDANGNGTVGQNELASAMHHYHHRHSAGAATDAGNAQNRIATLLEANAASHDASNGSVASTPGS